MIHTSLSPNTERDDLWAALKWLISPWRWRQWKEGAFLQKFESSFQKKLGVKQAISFQRGRDALTVLLRSMGIERGDEVILQAYTCIVVPNAIRFAGAKPVYVDLEEKGFNIDPEGIKNSITERTKAVIVQHTFGEPADLDAILKICRDHNIPLVEDCAHSLSGNYREHPLGTFGKAAIWSFGRDKIISSVWGGMVTTDDEELAKKVRDSQRQLPFPSFFQIKQALLHPLLFALIKPLYHWKWGRGILVFFQKLRVLPKVIFPAEKAGKKPNFMPQRMPNALAELALHQLQKLDRFLFQRQQMAQLYRNALEGNDAYGLPVVRDQSRPAWLRYTIRTPKAGKILKEARSKGWYLGDWYRSVLAPPVHSLSTFGYREGSCPRAEKAAQETLNLPTHIQMSVHQQKELVDFLQSG